MFLRSLASRICYSLMIAALISTLAVQSVQVLGTQPARLLLLDEVGFGDSLVLHGSLRLLRTGHVYHALTDPPYLPSIYSPLVYHLYARPTQWFPENPFIGPRLVVLCSFILCVGVVVSITRRLLPVSYSWIWALLLATSIQSMGPWILQLRGDFPGVLFGLMSIRFLMIPGAYAAALAGVCAGMALQFKITYAAALVSGALWLVIRKEWKAALGFSIAAGVTCVGIYGLFAMKEPRMLSQVFALSTIVRDLQGCIKIVLQVSAHIVVLLALAGIPRFLTSVNSRRFLVVLFAGASLGIACVTDLQAGGNINYFFEALLALVPIAVAGCYQLMSGCRRQPGMCLFVAGVILYAFAVPSARKLLQNPETLQPAETTRKNERMRRVYQVLEGRHLFSTIPRLALLDPNPPLMDAFFLSYLGRLGKLDTEPWLRSIRQEEFDAVILAADEDAPESYRTIRRMEPEGFRETIPAHYRLHCTILGARIYLPRNRPEDGGFLRQLQEVGCEP